MHLRHTAKAVSVLNARIVLEMRLPNLASVQERQQMFRDGFLAGVRPGIVQTRTNVAPKQFLTVVEHQQPGAPTRPSFTSVSRSTNGAVDLSVTGEADLRYVFEASTNLVNWTRLGVRTNLTGSIQFTDPRATNFIKRFYRVSVP